MNPPCKILVICSAILILAGCGNTRQKAETKGIKIGELAPAGRGSTSSKQGRLEMQILHTTNINVITYELPADKIAALDDIWQILNTSSFRYNDANGFSANGLRAGAGTIGTFSKVIGILTTAKAKKLYATSLMIQTSQPEMIDIARLTRKTAIFYIGQQGVTQSTETGPGTLGLQIIARQILPNLQAGTGSPASASIHITPVISSSIDGLTPELAARLKANDLRIYSAGFGFNIKPGDFVVLAPGQSSPDETTAASRFFIKQEPTPTIRVLLLICTSIT